MYKIVRMTNNMHYSGLFLIFGALTLFLVSAQTRPCFKGETKCGPFCYYPMGKQCLGNAYGIQYPCFKGQSVCGNNTISRPICYDTKIQDCHLVPDGSFTDPEVCFKGQRICEGWLSKCYNPNSENCFPRTEQDPFARVCNKGQVLCGQLCFDPTVQDCFKLNNTVPNVYPCFKGQQICGFDCYNTASHECLSYNTTSNTYYRACEIGQRLCKQRCYNPQVYNCVEDKLSLMFQSVKVNIRETGNVRL